MFFDDPRNLKYNGLHRCPRCGAESMWKGIDSDSRRIRVCCEGSCGMYEDIYDKLSNEPYFEERL
jgi:transcription elongation factor Elf1